MADPTTHRLVRTRDGVARIPRAERGVPIAEYFQNVELPNDISRMAVFNTPNGPALATPDPMPWTQEHTKQVNDYADRLKAQIDERGYYARSLENFAERLSGSTGYAQEEMKAAIVARFEEVNGADPYAYLNERRQAQGLPVREQASRAPGHDYEQD
jgi:hypothetical protein